MHRRGKGWSFHDQEGRHITDPEEVERLKALVVPPAWTDVWLSLHPRGHIQATGRDDAG